MKKEQLKEGKRKTATKPAYVSELEAVYGPPSDGGFGSAVFFERLAASDELEQAALDVYQSFVGELWQRWGEEAWMGSWRTVYERPADAQPAIVDELNAIDDRDAALSVPLLFNADGAQDVLAQAYDADSVTELLVYTIGDGEAMSGVLVAGRRNGDGAVFVVVLLD